MASKKKKPLLTEYDRQVLMKIGRDCKRNSPIKSRHWVDPPDMAVVRAALHKLFLHEMIKATGAWWRVQPTPKGWDQIQWERMWCEKNRPRR
jgi:hypothetical protein